MVFINMQSLPGLWSYNWGKHCSFRNASMYHIITNRKIYCKIFNLILQDLETQLAASYWLLGSFHLKLCNDTEGEITISTAQNSHQKSPVWVLCPGAPPCRLQERRLHGGGAEGNWRLGARQAAINQKAEQSQQDTGVRPPDEICEPAACVRATHSGKIIILWYHLKQSRLGLLPEPAPGFYTCLSSRALAKL